MNEQQETNVDVLAVLGALNLADPSQRHDLTSARAAVAELIAASRYAASVLQDKTGSMEQETPRRLFAALARVGGAA